jgi:hypothetical protein
MVLGGRLGHLVAAGVVDSLCLSIGWTILVLEVLSRHGLGAAGVFTAASLVGVALSAPVASAAARRWDGRALLRRSVTTEAVLRLALVGLVQAGAPLWSLALGAAALNVCAWTGYAGMRAEVAAITHGPAALTWYCTLVAAVEAVGIALAAVLPVTTVAGSGGAHPWVATVYTLGLLPTYLVAGRSVVGRSAGHPRARTSVRLRSWATGPASAGAVFMLAGSGPTLLSVVLAERLHGRSAVAVAALAFTVGSLAAPVVARRLDAWSMDRAVVWATCAVGMVAGWALAPAHVGFLVLAQVSSGVFMTTLEGLSDTAAARRRPGQVTGALAHASATRALGSAGATASFPVLVVQVGLPTGVGCLVLGAVLVAPLLIAVSAARGPGRRPRHRLAAPPARRRPGPSSGRPRADASAQPRSSPAHDSCSRGPRDDADRGERSLELRDTVAVP